MINSDIARYIRENGRYVGVPTGTSMFPMLHNKADIIVIEPFDKKPEIRDVALYLRADGSHVLHRIVGKDENGYIMCGDNQWVKEHGIKADVVLGELKGFYRGERYIDCKTDKKYLRYVRFWDAFFPVRRLLLKFIRKFYLMRGKGD